MPDENRTPPALCAKSYNPYTYCPLMFKHQDDFISTKIEEVWAETKRLNGLDRVCKGDEAKMLDRYIGEITAYMNGRIDEVIRLLNKPKEV